MLKKIHKHNFKPWANIYGDLVGQFNGARTVHLCTECYKRKYSKEYVEAPINYNNLTGYWTLYKMDVELANDYLRKNLNNILKDKEAYITIFNKDESSEVKA